MTRTTKNWCLALCTWLEALTTALVYTNTHTQMNINWLCKLYRLYGCAKESALAHSSVCCACVTISMESILYARVLMYLLWYIYSIQTYTQKCTPALQNNEEEIVDDNVLKTSWYTECSASESVLNNNDKKEFRRKRNRKMLAKKSSSSRSNGDSVHTVHNSANELRWFWWTYRVKFTSFGNNPAWIKQWRHFRSCHKNLSFFLFHSLFFFLSLPVRLRIYYRSTSCIFWVYLLFWF